MAASTVLSLLQPKLTFRQSATDGAIKKGVEVTKPDGRAMDGYDLKRLQVLT